MWSDRARQNRRLSPGHVLDVKLRSDQARAARTRFAAVAIFAGLGTVAGLCLLWRLGGWSLDKFIYDNPAFAIEQVEVQTDGSIPLEQLRRWSGVRPGENLIRLDLAAVKSRLEMVSTLDTVSIERILPRTLKIRVTERRPMAQVNLLGSLPSNLVALAAYQLDKDGFVMQPLDARQPGVEGSRENHSLPALTGLNRFDLQPGHRLESTQAQAALRLIAAFNQSPMAGLVELRGVDVSEPGVVVLTTAQDGEITFAPDNFKLQLDRWHRAYVWGRDAGKTIATLDLAIPGKDEPATWAAAGAPPPATPQPATPLHPRRNHV